MPSIKNTLAELKKHPGQPGNNDDHKYKRTYSLDVTLSPIELEAFRNEWIKSEFNSLASFARYKFFGGAEHKIELYFEQKREDKILSGRLLAELNKEGKNLNQIAKQLSSKTDFTRQEAKLLVDDIKNTLLAIQEIKEKFSQQKKI